MSACSLLKAWKENHAWRILSGSEVFVMTGRLQEILKTIGFFSREIYSIEKCTIKRHEKFELQSVRLEVRNFVPRKVYD